MEAVVSYLRSVSPRNLIISGLLLTGSLFFVLGLVQYLSQPPAIITYSSSQEVKAAEDATETLLMVDVSGEVTKPGVYQLKEGSRVKDALRAAGGLSEAADREYIARNVNLAQKVVDSMKIYVPAVGETTQNTQQGNLTGINSASTSDLDKLPGIGQTTAQKIIDGRPYTAVDDLLSRKVVTKKQFEQIKDRISVN